MKTIKSEPLSSPNEERGPDHCPRPPTLTVPVIGAVIIPGELWPSVGARQVGTEILLEA
jgi:hypothetical protein